jgi:hypothetical protein
MGLHELKNFFTTKEMVTKLKRLPTEWERIFASCTSDKGLIRIYRELKKVSSQNINDPMKKWAKDLKFFQRKTSKWPKNTRRNAQHPWSQKKFKSQPH